MSKFLSYVGGFAIALTLIYGAQRLLASLNPPSPACAVSKGIIL